MKVIGIDPAPTKASCVFDGTSLVHLRPTQLAKYVAEQAQSDIPTLICWDAPLTGPKEPDSSEFRASDQSKRPIESFFGQGEWGLKVPKGISVLGYAGCPHWAITRRILGLPRVGRFDAAWETLPFRLVVTNPSPVTPLPPKTVVEVHPALALWIWLKDEVPANFVWEYKRAPTLVTLLWTKLLTVLRKRGVDPLPSQLATIAGPTNDDELDALVSWLLGNLWLHTSNQVAVIGNLASGSFLLPTSNALSVAYQKFSARSNWSVENLLVSCETSNPIGT